MIPHATTRPDDNRMTVFLSHSTRDADFVAKLAMALDASGFTPWSCEVDIETGANFVAKINEGLAQSDVALLVWSPEAAASRWTQEEWTSQKARQVEESKIRLAVIMLREHPLPPLLRTSNYIEAHWDQAAGIRKTVEWLKGRQSVQRLSGQKAPVYLPDYRPQDFVGRSAYLTTLQDKLVAEPGVFLLYGEPGTGKSMLALRFAWEAQKDFDAVIFQTCGQRPLDAITTELADRLPIDVKTRPPEEQRAAAKAWLRERQSLLVLDDVWPNQEGKIEVRQLEPGPACSVLYTSRQTSLPGLSSALRARVEKFTAPEAEALFHAYLDADFGAAEVTRNREALLAFAAQVEMLPIAVAVGASLLREKSASVLGKAVLKLRLDNLTDGSKDVNALFRTAINSQPAREQKLLAAGAVCVQEGFWLPLSAEIAELSEDEAEDAANRLVHSSLLRVVDRERRRFNLHALLRDEVRARQGDDGIVKLKGHHAAALEKLFGEWETRWKECSECLEEIVPATRFLYQSGQPARGGLIADWGWNLSDRIGELDAALRISKFMESLWEGRDDRDAREGRQRSYHGQAQVLYQWGRLEEAMALLNDQRAICEELGNKEGLAGCYGTQAVVLMARERNDEALTLLKEQEAIGLQLGDKILLKLSYGNQALILQGLGKLEEAIQLLDKTQAICWELDSKNDLAISYGNKALILRAWGRLGEALKLHKEMEAICIELGLKRELGYCYWQWGDTAREQGDHKTRKEKLEQALAIFSELKMQIQRNAVQAELVKVDSG